VRLRQPDAVQAWARFVELYAPLIHTWARRTGLQDADADDLVQEVFVLLREKLPEFVYDRAGSFRGWLRAVTMNLWRNQRRQAARRPVALPAGVEPTLPDAVAEFWEEEFGRELVARAAAIMRKDFKDNTWKAFLGVVVYGKSYADVATELGMTKTAVGVARHRVLQRLREEVAGMLD
jgi:RNA polymerase sigma-70 factor, ECF subfamily